MFSQVSLQNIPKNCFGDDVSTKNLSIYSVRRLTSTKAIYTVTLKAFGLCVVVNRLLVHLGRDGTALGKGKRS